MLQRSTDLSGMLEEGQERLTERLDRIVELLEELLVVQGDGHDMTSSGPSEASPVARRTA